MQASTSATYQSSQGAWPSPGHGRPVVGARTCICCWISFPTKVHQQRYLELKQKPFLFSKVSFKVGIETRRNCWFWISLLGRGLLLTYEPELFYYLCKSMDACEAHNVNKCQTTLYLVPAVHCINTSCCFRSWTPEKISYRGLPSCNRCSVCQSWICFFLL